MYSRACPASCAENCVVSPIFFARAFSFSISAPEAWDIAWTVLIWASNPMPTAVDALKRAAVPAAASLLPLTMVEKKRSEALPRASIPFTLIPPKESLTFLAEIPAFCSRVSNSFLAFRIDAEREASVPPEISISSS